MSASLRESFRGSAPDAAERRPHLSTAYSFHRCNPNSWYDKIAPSACLSAFSPPACGCHRAASLNAAFFSSPSPPLFRNSEPPVLGCFSSLALLSDAAATVDDKLRRGSSVFVRPRPAEVRPPWALSAPSVLAPFRRNVAFSPRYRGAYSPVPAFPTLCVAPLGSTSPECVCSCRSS